MNVSTSMVNILNDLKLLKQKNNAFKPNKRVKSPDQNMRRGENRSNNPMNLSSTQLKMNNNPTLVFPK